jgi:hypothetical protein
MPLSAGFIHILTNILTAKLKLILCEYLIIYSEIDQPSFRDYNSNFDGENKSSTTFRQVSVINEEPDDLTSPLQRANYALDFRYSNDEDLSRKSLEQNIKGFVDGCVRSSLHDISHANREANSKFI